MMSQKQDGDYELQPTQTLQKRDVAHLYAKTNSVATQSVSSQVEFHFFECEY